MSAPELAYILLAFQALVLGASVSGWWQQRKQNRWMNAEYDRIRQKPQLLADEMQKQMLHGIGVTVELLERVQCDLVFLHDAMALTDRHPRDCPVCRSTLPQLDAVIHRLRTVKLHTRIEEL